MAVAVEEAADSGLVGFAYVFVMVAMPGKGWFLRWLP